MSVKVENPRLKIEETDGSPSGFPTTFKMPNGSLTDNGDNSYTLSAVGPTRAVNTTSPLIGGGDLSADRTLSIAGLSALGTANQIPGTNSGATGWEYKTVNGTSNQITVTHAANAITLSTPQNIHTAASPTFAGITLTSFGTITNAATAGTPSTATTINTGDPSTVGLKLVSKRYTPSGSNPDTVSGLILWFKADAITGLNDGDPVTTWNDSSVSANNATQATASQKPLYKTNILNGKPVVRFDGSNDELVTINNTGISGNYTLTVFAVFKSTVSPADYPAIFSQNPGTTDLGVSLTLNGNRPALDSWINRWRVDNAINTTDFYVVSITKAAGALSPNSTIYHNGTSQAGAVEGANGTPNVTSAVMRIGSLDNLANRYITGDLAELIIYNAVLSTSDRQAVERYLALKYNLVINSTTDQTSDMLQMVNPAGTTVLSLTSGPSLGIGTTSPQNLLHLYGTPARMRVQMAGTSASDFGDFAYVDSSGNIVAGVLCNSTGKTDYGGGSSLNIVQVGASPLTLCTSNLVRVTVDSAGRMGIGETSPTTILHVGGGFTAKTTSTSVNLTLDATHNTVYATTGVGGITVTLPAASSSTIGRIYYIFKVDSGIGLLTVSPTGTDTLNGVNGNKTVANQWNGMRVQGHSATSWIITSFTGL